MASAAARSLVIITGASRGFGKSIALALADSPLVTAQATDVILTARNMADLNDTKYAVERVFNEADVITRHPLNLFTCAVDFSSQNLDTMCDFIVQRTVPHAPSEYTTVYLFNNAGTLGKLARMRDQTLNDIRRNLEVNLTAPILLTSAFLKRFASEVPKSVIVNVSSLAAVQPFDTWGMYSATKAARDMLHRVIAVEEANIETEETLPGFGTRRSTGQEAGSGTSEAPSRLGRVRVLNYAPGPLDTDMQARIRNEMPDVQLKQVYVKLHEEGQLVDPNDSAHVLISLLEADEFENGAHIDFYDQRSVATKNLVGK
eukprot:jgi/Hompol1/3616/HPOL_003303-RA